MAPRSQRSCIVCEQPSKYTCASCKADYCSVACYSRHKGLTSTIRGHTLLNTTCSARSHPNDTSDVRPNVLLDGRGTRSFVGPDAHDHSAAELVPSVDKDKVEDGDAAEPLQDPRPLRPLTTLKWPYIPDTSAYPDPLARDDPKPLQMHQYEALATSPTVRAILESNPRLCELLTSINTRRGGEREEALQRALGIDSRRLKIDVNAPLDDDTKAFRAFAEAVEVAVRGGRGDLLGLDWD